jgi:DNA-binding transcriptional LysR family regulator
VQQASLQQENLARVPMVCVVPKGMLPPFKLRAGSLSLDDLTGVPTISLDAQDPVGMLLSQLARESSAGLNHYVTVQTYHTALAMAHHGLGVAMVDGCTALSADTSKVDVLPLAPGLQVPVNAIRAVSQPQSLLVKAITREMQKVLAAQL